MHGPLPPDDPGDGPGRQRPRPGLVRRRPAAPAGAPVYEKTLEVLVFEAVRTLKHAATVERIGAYIEAGYDVPPMFRKQLAAHLRSLREAGRLVMSKSAFALPGRTGVRPHLCFSYRFYAIR